MTPMKLTNLSQLVDANLIDAGDIPALEPVAERYAIAISPTITRAIADQPDGPLARQFVPDAREATTLPHELSDPIGDDLKTPVTGIVHRYPDRALLKLATACPVYCRFCFRREKVGPGQPAMLTAAQCDAALAYIADTPALWEIIITGGDPLVLAPRYLSEVTNALSQIEHVKIIRWHTRVPVVAPELMTPARIRAISAKNKTTYVMLHVNHCDEFTPEADAAIANLREAGLNLRSQTVLLRGINDNLDTLGRLMRAFVERGIAPYYLHHPDLAPGTSHFRLSIADGQRLVAGLRGSLSGIAQPTYVFDIPGAHGKVPIGPNYVETTADRTRITDPGGTTHTYTDPRPEGR